MGYSLWVVYDLKNINIDEPRAILFSRFLVIDPAQYRNLLDEQTHPDCAVMLRYAMYVHFPVLVTK